MQSLCYIALLFLWSSALLPSVLSIQCNETVQYAWPMDLPKFCCDKCLPGQHMDRRSEKVCEIKCKPCTSDRYTDTYNVQMSCTIIENCNKPNMEYESRGSATHNAVCRCKDGFRCRDQPCTQCIPIPTTTTKPTLPPSTTAFKPFTSTTHRASTTPVKDTMPYLVITVLLCAGISIIIVITKLKTFLRWIRFNHGYFLAEKPTPQSESITEDEGVSKPVQEMCGKCEQPIDV